MIETTINVLADGRVAFLHDDALVELCDAGGTELFRASHVEPAAAYGIEGGGWVADLGPVGGPILGPFRRRGDALAAERDWLDPRLAGIAAGK